MYDNSLGPLTLPHPCYTHTVPTSTNTFGTQLRTWRQKRRLSQLHLALDAGISARHLSFLETGRSRPSRDMVLLLAEQLRLPLREQNALLLAAGFAPSYGEQPFDAPELDAVRDAVDLVLANHEPFPALAVNRRWDVLRSNQGAGVLIEGIAPFLLGPPLNVYRASLHPEGLRRRILNFEHFAGALLSQLRRDAEASADPELSELLNEVENYPALQRQDRRSPPPSYVVQPLQLRSSLGTLSFITTIATFGTPYHTTVAELAIESFFPADAATAQRLRAATVPA